jgi:hypothetical protein
MTGTGDDPRKARGRGLGRVSIEDLDEETREQIDDFVAYARFPLEELHSFFTEKLNSAEAKSSAGRFSGPDAEQRRMLLRIAHAWGQVKEAYGKQAEFWEGWIRFRRERERQRTEGQHETPVADLEDALARVQRIVKTTDPLGAFVILLWALQAHLVEFLDSVFYLAFKGQSGAGKGTALESALLLTPNGELLSITTPAVLAAVLDDGKALGIPEADKLLAKDPLIGKILRDGYRRGASYGLMIPTGDPNHPWKQTNRSLFGPKAFDFHVSIDSHLLGRAVVQLMERDNSVDRAMDAERKARRLAPVRAWVARQTVEARRNWTRESLDALWDDAEFRKEVARMGGSTGRDHVVAATMLVLCRLVGWEYADQVRKTIRGRKTLDELGEESEVLDAIKGMATGHEADPEFELTTEDLLIRINDQRKRQSLYSLSPRALGGVLSELGFKRDEDWFRGKQGPNRDKSVVRPERLLRELAHTDSAQAAHPAQKSIFDLHCPDGEPVSRQNGPVGPDGPAGIIPAPEAVVNVRTLFKRAAPEPVDWTIARPELARTTGISEAEYDQAVGGLVENGELVRVSAAAFKAREPKP